MLKSSKVKRKIQHSHVLCLNESEIENNIWKISFPQYSAINNFKTSYDNIQIRMNLSLTESFHLSFGCVENQSLSIFVYLMHWHMVHSSIDLIILLVYIGLFECCANISNVLSCLFLFSYHSCKLHSIRSGINENWIIIDQITLIK